MHVYVSIFLVYTRKNQCTYSVYMCVYSVSSLKINKICWVRILNINCPEECIRYYISSDRYFPKKTDCVPPPSPCFFEIDGSKTTPRKTKTDILYNYVVLVTELFYTIVYLRIVIADFFSFWFLSLAINTQSRN